jgi:anti-sigma regulatory factor (Ser/Thr protein kinase)
MEQQTREFPSELRHLAALRALVREECRRVWGDLIDEAWLVELELAVDEAASNVVIHAYEGKPGLPIEVAVTADADRVCVTLLHRGKPFDPNAVAPPAFDGSRESGFGLYLIRQAVDELTFFEDECGRHGIRLVKQRIPTKA